MFKEFKAPPHSLEAEMSALGSAMMGAKFAEQFLHEAPDVDLFYHPAHREVYHAIVDLVQNGQAVDLVTLKNWLIPRDKLKSAGGIEYLINLMEVVPTASNLVHYCHIVRDYATLRQLQKAGKDIAEIVNDPELTVAEKLEKARGMVEASSNVDAITSTAASINLEGTKLVVPWQLGKIGPVNDQSVGRLGKTVNGLYLGQITTVEADTGIGKSWAAQQSIISMLRAGYRVRLVLLADMTDEDVAGRLLAMMCGMSTAPVFDDPLDDENEKYERRWQDAVAEFRSWGDRLEIYDSSKDGNDDTVQGIQAWLLSRQHKASAQAVFIDYMQMIRWKGKTSGLTEEGNLVARELGKLCKKLGSCAMIVLSQVNQEGQTQYSTQLEKVAAVRVQLTVASEDGSESEVLKWAVKKHRFKPVRGYVGFFARDHLGRFFDTVFEKTT